MKIILNTNKLKNLIFKDKNLGFVPTMGGIHKGHIYLIKKSITQCKKTVVSIFINKPQFNKKNDYLSYPRILKKDIKILKSLKIDILFIPRFKQIYPNGTNKNLKISPLENKLCGKLRPGHFKAVVDVIERFIAIIKPKNIYLGQKDMQQLRIIEKFFKKNNVRTKVIECKTIREKNGMAYSSRNFLLSSEDKKIGSKIYKLLVKQKHNLIMKKISINKIKSKIISLGASKIDYIEILNSKSLCKSNDKKYLRVFISYYIKNVRLIDNV